MTKKNLIILLLIPFLIALLGVVTINTTFHFIDNDIIAIQWDYDDTEAFKLQDNLYLLEAVGVNQKNYPAGAGNTLVWSIRNRNIEDDNVYGEIVKQDQHYYLKTLACGEVIITCSNEKGTIFKSMHAIIYENGAILIQTKIRGSQNNIDQTIYYGEYDLENQNKIKASVDLEITAVPKSISSLLRIENQTDNIEIDLMNHTLEIKDAGFASFTISCGDENIAKNATYSFEVVENGVNVYSYDDLLNCSNYSNTGEIIVLRKSFESLENAYQMSASGEVLLEDGKPVLKENNVEYEEVEKLEDVMPQLDILYMTRVQRERFFNEDEYLRIKNLILKMKSIVLLQPIIKIILISGIKVLQQVAVAITYQLKF